MGSEEIDEQDLTRKQRREQAREQRKELEAAEAAGAVRRQRLVQLGIVAGIVVAIVVAILVATGGGKNTHVVKNTGERNATVAEVKSLVGGIPQAANVLGEPNAPVTLRFYGDLECPICREFTLGALPSLIQNYVRSGKLRIEYHALETATRDPEVFKTQQIAALAAGKQDKMWYFVELFYHEQGEEDSGYVTESYLQNLAQQVPGLNLTEWTTSRNDPEYANVVSSDAQAANNVGFTGTPSFLIGKTGGTFKKLEYSSLTEPGSFDSAIEGLLKS
jgi:protein-disulfide isomerase